MLVSAVICASHATRTMVQAAGPIVPTTKDGQFTPSELNVPAGERLRIGVESQFSTPTEFESTDMRVEKIVVPGGRITVMTVPLNPGTYKFFDDYHPDTAKGMIISVERKTQE